MSVSLKPWALAQGVVHFNWLTFQSFFRHLGENSNKWVFWVTSLFKKSDGRSISLSLGYNPFDGNGFIRAYVLALATSETSLFIDDLETLFIIYS